MLFSFLPHGFNFVFYLSSKMKEAMKWWVAIESILILHMLVLNHHAELMMAISYGPILFSQLWFNCISVQTMVGRTSNNKCIWFLFSEKKTYKNNSIYFQPNAKLVIQFSKYIDNLIFAHNCKFRNCNNIEQSICK